MTTDKERAKSAVAEGMIAFDAELEDAGEETYNYALKLFKKTVAQLCKDAGVK